MQTQSSELIRVEWNHPTAFDTTKKNYKEYYNVPV